MRFIKDERRIFDLTKTIEEIIFEAMDGKYSYDKYDELYELRKRASTAEIGKLVKHHQSKFDEILEK